MTTATAEELTEAYHAFRLRLTSLGRSLEPQVAGAKTPTCPEWSPKDILAHMTGIAADILDGNVEGAATEAWADVQVEKRRAATLSDVLDEWDSKGPLLEDLLANVAPAIAYQFYLDAWTHEWDLRQAIDAGPIEPDYALVAHTVPAVMDSLTERLEERRLTPVKLELSGLAVGPYVARFDASPATSQGRPTASISMTFFEFLRIAMGRRSKAQIEAALGTADLPEGDWVDAFVVWSVNDQDIIDPVIA